MAGRRSLITLTTDFGSAGYHVGVMKGVILSRNPDATLVDLCHGVPPGDIQWGAWTLLWNWRYFPPGTVHVAVVDPGVGTERKALAAAAGGHFFVGPDNGLMGPVLADAGLSEAVFIDLPAADKGAVSSTFHGRDIFAPTAARISLGTALAEIGPPSDQVVALALPAAEVKGPGVLAGEVVAVDPFGNLVTSITGGNLAEAGASTGARIDVGGRMAAVLGERYADGAAGKAVGLVNSSGHLEIAVNGGRADTLLGAGKGTSVSVRSCRAE